MPSGLSCTAVNICKTLKTSTYNPTSDIGPPITQEAILDTGSTGHYFGLDIPLQDTRPSITPLNVELPDKSIIHSTHTGLLQIPALPPAACLAHQFPKLSGTSLISIGQLCDHGCEVRFYHDQAIVIYKDEIILHGR